MSLTVWDLCFWGASFAVAWLSVPAAWVYVRGTADRAVEGFGRERVALRRNVILMGIGAVALMLAITVYGITRGLVPALLTAGIGVVAPGWALTAYQGWRRLRFQQQFLDVLLMIANSLRAGFNMSQAVEIVAREMPGPARDEFARVVRDRDLGMTLDEGLERMAGRMQGESVQIFVTAVQVGRQTGGDLTLILDGLVKMIRERERVEDRVRTMTSETRFQGYTLAALPYLLLAGWFCLDPQGVRGVFGTGWGKCLLVIGTVFNGMALVAIKNLAMVKV